MTWIKNSFKLQPENESNLVQSESADFVVQMVIGLIISLTVLAVNCFYPCVIFTCSIHRRFEILMLKEAKQGFNSLLLKIDKASRDRVQQPLRIFLRKFIYAILLTLPMNNIHFLWQYAFFPIGSLNYLIYLIRVQPYKTPAWNRYMIITEAFYFYVIVALFFFMVDAPSRYVKMFLGLTCLFATLSIVLTSLFMTIYLAVKGPSKLKRDDKESKLRRAEKEALERMEKEERKLKI